MVLERLISSKGRVALFKALFDGRGKKAHIAEIAHESALSAPSLMREAKSLVRLGLLSEERDGNRVDYYANQESPLYSTIVALVDKTEGGEEVLRRAFADCDAEVVFIYGSRAKGTERTDSDYDVFVIGNEGLRKISARVRSAADEIAAEINPYVITREEFADRLAKTDHFLADVIASPKIFLKGGPDELARLA